jgi:hypothetical protein
MYRISYVISTISIILNPIIETPHVVLSHHPKYYGERNSVPIGIPTQSGMIHQICASQLWAPYFEEFGESQGEWEGEEVLSYTSCRVS